MDYRRAYTASVVADLSVIVLIVACTAIAGCCALVTLSLWRAAQGRLIGSPKVITESRSQKPPTGVRDHPASS